METAPKRSCGDCALCCILVGVGEIDKPAYRACRHLAGAFQFAQRGCTIYPQRPRSCAGWSCCWLTSPDWPDDLRPDRCGVVFDPAMDVIRLNGVDMPCGQIWVSAGHEEDYNSPLILGAMLGMLKQVKAIIWRLPPGDQARVIVEDAQGRLQISAVHGSTPNALGGEQARLRRLRELTDGAHG